MHGHVHCVRGDYNQNNLIAGFFPHVCVVRILSVDHRARRNKTDSDMDDVHVAASRPFTTSESAAIRLHGGRGGWADYPRKLVKLVTESTSVRSRSALVH